MLRSGDVVIMSGPECRRAYHGATSPTTHPLQAYLVVLSKGVPRILEGTLPPHLQTDDDSDWPLYRAYMQSTRVNINVRQVFPKGFEPDLNIH